MDPKVAIVIPSYNSIEFLCETVSSAKNQVYKNFDIYIYDNESTDGSYELAKSLEENDRKINVFQVKNIYERSYREAFDDSFKNLNFYMLKDLANGKWTNPAHHPLRKNYERNF